MTDTTFDIHSVQVDDAPIPAWEDTGEEVTRDSPPEDIIGAVKQRTRKLRERVAGTGEPPAPKPPKPIPPKPRQGQLVKPLTDMYASVGMMVYPFDPVCGQVFINCAEQCATALENAARENPAIRRVVYGLVETSVWGQLIAAHAPILMTIAAHHITAYRGVMDNVTLPSQEGDTANPGASE